MTWSDLSCQTFILQLQCGRSLEQTRENGSRDRVRNFTVASLSDFWSGVKSKGMEAANGL